MLWQVCGAISIAIFTFATWIGFVPLKGEEGFNPKQCEHRIKGWINRVILKRLHCNWAINSRYALTKISLGIAAGLGIASIFLAN